MGRVTKIIGLLRKLQVILLDISSDLDYGGIMNDQMNHFVKKWNQYDIMLH